MVLKAISTPHHANLVTAQVTHILRMLKVKLLDLPQTFYLGLKAVVIPHLADLLQMPKINPA
jgi:hypothetical protein